MGEYLVPLLFLIVVFVGFGLAHRDRRARGCGDCSNDCDSTRCDNP